MTLKENKFTWPTIQRLSEYLIILEQLAKTGEKVISSSDLANYYGNTPSQVRQDIFRLPNTGRVGHGYDISKLSGSIRDSLLMTEETNVIIIGCGNLGSTLASHIPFTDYGMRLLAIFDKSQDVIGTDIAGIKVRSTSDMSEFIKENDISVACLCVPTDVAQETVDKLIPNGVNSFLNYSKARLQVPPEVFVQHEQIVCSFMKVVYASKILKNREEN
jgi:redox-sensing transcriptional repressor